MKTEEFIKTAYSRLLAANSKLLRESDVFCMAPWIQLHAQTNGKVAPCCMSTVYDGNELGDLRQNPNLEEAWNSENMKQLRLNMLSGKKSSICTHCYSYEKAGRRSERMQYNQEHKRHYSKVAATQSDGSLKDLEVPLIDIRFSNKCNYKCRICDSVYSSLWYEEEIKTGKQPGLPATKEMKVSGNDAEFWKSYLRFMPKVKRLHFAGGEPLFMDEHYEALEHLIAIGKTDVTLSYNTNFSTLRYKKYNVTELWNKFKEIVVWASLDDMNQRGDYQRKGQKWEKIEENIRTVQRECNTVSFGVNATVSMFNVLQTPAFVKHMIENKLVQPERMNLYLLFDPSYMNLTNLPPAIKQKAAQQLEDLDKDFLSKLRGSTNLRNHIQAVITYMMSAQGNEQAAFKQWISAIDAVRDENFVSVFPELAALMQTT